MVIHTTRWRTDTCPCIIQYTWDDAQPVATRTHTISNVDSKCAIHTLLSTNTDLWNCLIEENSRKNFALQVILDNGPNTLYDMVGTSRVLKPTLTYNHSFSGTAPNRILNVSITGVTLTTTQRNTITTALNTRFGAGKVILG